MKKKSVILCHILAWVTFSLAGCNQTEQVQTRTQRPPRAVTKPTPEQQKKTATDPEMLLHEFRQSYRLVPDRRFMVAIEELDGLFSELPSAKVQTSYTDDQWTIRFRDETLGTVSEFPRFEELFGIVRKYAAIIGPKLNIKGDEDANDIMPTPGIEALQVLQNVDQEWSNGKQTLTSVRTAARAYISLLVGFRDVMETTDRLAMKAIALCALVDVLAPDSCPREKALLARALG
ncbi:hypothetical protein ACFL27_02145 [candidate division CSSED10-310 bacterium]|uniref:Lipoprotein n=1 Tax=candidate division CSSED10-310 bacterium TaxID=2855610 RepID=A0ABV6YSA1_UNCC1